MEFSADQARFRQWQAEWTKSLDRSFDENGHLSTKAIGLLETKLQEEVHSGYVRLCRTWPDGLSAVLAALELGENDAVFLPCVGSAEILRPILQTGAEAVFCDIHPRTFTLDVLSLQKAIRQVMYEAKKRARVVLSIDTFGLPCDYPALEKICETYGLFLVEISPDGLGGSLRRQEIPGFGTAGILSFSPRTTVPAFADGAAVFTNDEELMPKISGWLGTRYDEVEKNVTYPALNSYLHPLEAGALLKKYQAYLDSEASRRAELAAFYSAQLQDILDPPFVPAGFESA